MCKNLFVGIQFLVGITFVNITSTKDLFLFDQEASLPLAMKCTDTSVLTFFNDYCATKYQSVTIDDEGLFEKISSLDDPPDHMAPEMDEDLSEQQADETEQVPVRIQVAIKVNKF